MCKIKGLETRAAKVVSSGTSVEMDRKLDEMGPNEETDDEPPRKKAKRGDKENKTSTKGKKQQKKKSTTKKKGGYSMAMYIYNAYLPVSAHNTLHVLVYTYTCMSLTL